MNKHYNKSKKKNNPYTIVFPRRKDFPLSEIQEWIQHLCYGDVKYINQKKQIVYEFKELDDAFRFKLHFGDHLDR